MPPSELARSLDPIVDQAADTRSLPGDVTVVPVVATVEGVPDGRYGSFDVRSDLTDGVVHVLSRDLIGDAVTRDDLSVGCGLSAWVWRRHLGRRRR
jgi:hypothetical protein